MGHCHFVVLCLTQLCILAKTHQQPRILTNNLRNVSNNKEGKNGDTWGIDESSMAKKLGLSGQVPFEENDNDRVYFGSLKKAKTRQTQNGRKITPKTDQYGCSFKTETYQLRNEKQVCVWGGCHWIATSIRFVENDLKDESYRKCVEDAKAVEAAKKKIKDEVENDIEEVKEPLELGALSPQILIDTVNEIRSEMENKVYDFFEQYIRKAGIMDRIENVLTSFDLLVEELKKYVTGLFQLTTQEISTLGKTIDAMFAERSPSLFEQLEGKCVSDGDSGDAESEDFFQESALKNLDFDSVPEDGFKEVDEVLSSFLSKMYKPPTTQSQSVVCKDGTKMENEVDKGAISVIVRGLKGGRYQATNGASLKSLVHMGLEAGVTINGGYTRVTGSAGFQVEFGIEEMEDIEDNERALKGTTKKKVNQAITNIKNNTSSTQHGEAGIRIYFPGASSAMDGWGGFDVGFTLQSLPNFEGLTFHFRHPWYTCDVAFNPSEWHVAGFTINYFTFTTLEELKNETASFPGFDEVMTHLVDAVDVSTWEESNSTEFSFIIGPHLAIGLYSTRCDWDTDRNLGRQPYSGGSAQCGNRRAEEVQSEITKLKTKKNSIHVSQEGRSLQQINTNELVKGIMNILMEFLGDGGIVVPYCFGKCSGLDSNKYIKGKVTLEPPDTCDGVTLTADAEEITLANTGYLILNELNENLADAVVDNLGGFGRLGLSNPSMSLEVTIYPKLSFKVSGSPLLPTLSASAGIAKVIFDELKKIVEGLTLEFTGTLQSREFLEMGFKVSSPPIALNGIDNISFQNTEGLGFDTYVNYKINTLPTPTSQILTFGMSIPLRICTASCTSGTPEYIFLKGALEAELTVGKSSPSLTLGGTFTMIGTWKKAFGLPIVHISNVIAGTAFDFSKSFPPVPTKLTLGGAICLGSSASCDNRVEKKFIEAKMYLHVNVNAPEESGFIAMISTMTLEHILNVAGEVSNSIKALTDPWIREMSADIKSSGIYPYKSNAEDCENLGNATALAVGDVDMDLDCFAYIAIAPKQEVTIDEVGIVIPKGISFGGRFSFLGKFDLKAKGNFDIFNPPTVNFEIEAEMVNLQLGNLLQFGESYNKEKGEVTGNAIFEMKFSNDPVTVYMNIECALYIPFIKTYGDVKLLVDSEKFVLDGEINVFDGIFNPYAHIEFKWDMTMFSASMGDIIFVGGILKVETLELSFDASGGTFNKASFAAAISCLNFLSISGSFEVERSNIGRFVMAFSVSANLGVVQGSASGNATLDLLDITKTNIGDISYSVDAPQWMKDVGKAIVGALNTVCEGVSDAISWAGDKLEEAGKVIADIGKPVVEYIAKIGSGVQQAAQHLLNGNLDAAWDQLEATATAVLADAEEALGDAGEAFVSALDDVAEVFDAALHEVLSFIGIKTIRNEKNRKNKVSQNNREDANLCTYQVVTYELYKTYDECYNLILGLVCDSKTSQKIRRTVNEYNDSYAKCLCERGAQEDIIKTTLDGSFSTGKAKSSTKLANQKLLDADIIGAADGANFPVDGKFQGTVTSGDHAMRVQVQGSANRLDDNQSGTFSVLRDFDVSSNNNVDNSLVGLQHTVGNKISEIQTTNLGTVSNTIKPVQKSEWYGYANAYNAPLLVRSQNAAICGIGSQYDNNSKSRRYRFKYCAPNMTAGKKGEITLNNDNSMECPGNRFITGIVANSDSFVLTCEEFERTETGHLCEWSAGGGWYNSWRGEFNFECGENSIMTGIKRMSSINYNDQLFSFKCCNVMKESNIITSDWTNYLNDYRVTLDANAVVDGRNAAICGISSHHNNLKYDRQFKFKYCGPKAASASRGTLQALGVTSFGGTWTMECPGNKFMSKVVSTFHNYYRDRKFTFHCGEFNGYVRNNSCQWSNGNHWVNKMDDDFTYACPPKMSIVAIASQHSNTHADRQFKFKCCRMQETMTPVDTSTTNYCSKGSDGGWRSNHHTAFLQSHQVNFDLNSPNELSQTAIFTEVKAFLNTRPHIIPAYTKSIITIALSPDQKTEVCRLDNRVCTNCGDVYNWREIEGVVTYKTQGSYDATLTKGVLLEQIEVSADGNHVWGITTHEELIYRRSSDTYWSLGGDKKEGCLYHGWFGCEQTYSYTQALYQVHQVSVSVTGEHVYAIQESDRKLMYRHLYGNEWISHHGMTNIRSVCIWGPEGWVDSFPMSDDTKYMSISANGHHHWIIDTEYSTFYDRFEGTGGDIHKVEVIELHDGKMKKLAVTGDGTDVWGVSLDDKIYERTGVRGNWEFVRAGFKSIAVTGDANHLWAVDTNGKVQYGTTCF